MYPWTVFRSEKTTTTFLCVEAGVRVFKERARPTGLFAKCFDVCYVNRRFPVKSLFPLGLGHGAPPVDRKKADPEVGLDYLPGHYRKPDFGLRARPAHHFSSGNLAGR